MECADLSALSKAATCRALRSKAPTSRRTPKFWAVARSAYSWNVEAFAPEERNVYSPVHHKMTSPPGSGVATSERLKECEPKLAINISSRQDEERPHESHNRGFDHRFTVHPSEASIGHGTEPRADWGPHAGIPRGLVDASGIKNQRPANERIRA